MSRSKRRLFVLIGPPTGDSREAGAKPLGRIRDIERELGRFNTAGDGSPHAGQPTIRLHGPGMVVELSTANDPATQAMVSVNDEQMAWPVLERMCRGLHYRLMDPESGRVMAFG
jgi:hypothetical protein